MSMTAKALVRSARPGEKIDVFDLVGRIEKAINALVRAKAKECQVDGELLHLTMMREKFEKAQTIIRPVSPELRVIYTDFSLGRYERRRMQIILDPADQAVLPQEGTVLLSIGMSGQYQEILSACAKALAPEGGYFYGDDSLDGFITGEELQQKMAEAITTC